MEICSILGVGIAVTNMKNTLNYIDNNLEEFKGKYICISNVHTTVMAYENKQYMDIQNRAILSLADGGPLSVVSKIKGFKHADRVTGPDLMEEIFKLSEKKGYTHYFYGSTEENLKKMKLRLNKKYPKLRILGMYSPPFKEKVELESEDKLKELNKINADFIWVGLGAPKQEKWMSYHENKVNSLMIGVGAGFDYMAGTIKRAPRWMQKYSLEWVYRLIQDPRRLFKRYIVTNTKFIYLIILEYYRCKR